ncbi:transcriptional regulator [Gilliamella sp. HK2]|uniref:RNA repair transcriptional activator RtcR n=1 Tax=unclassified Gilliamella TaxID=2685620 RepID=UPI00080E0CB4|nr:RNA repair transcriptional activator RtcR [Gilliamella apicola]OCG24044.1 transcriptional regulator [Gilliamella apicola]OCG28277.1 transcriptional regulator [Gilliamella apicola]
MKKNVVFGFLGNVLDQRSKGKRRWLQWRPTIDLCHRSDLPLTRFELLYYQNDYHLLCEVVKDIKILSPQIEVRPIAVNIDDPWDFEQVYTCLFDISKNYSFNSEQEEYYLHITTGTHVAQICWFLLAESRYYPAKLLQMSPPSKKEIMEKKYNLAEADLIAQVPYGKMNIIDLNLHRYDKILTRFQQYAIQATDLLKSGIATRNQQFNQLIAEIEQVASRSHAPILLCGPTGAGKSFLAKQIYLLKHTNHQINGQFVEINCATLRGDSAMSTLFGHVKGAFTGANFARSGLLKNADGGVLFLDEIGELGLDEQAMLLKAIEEKQFYPFGSDKPIQSDFQLIAGTNKDLKLAIVNGEFREDLFTRINLWSYQLPSLAERKEDIEPNIDYELARYAKEYGIMPRFNQQSRRAYLAFATSPEALWLGNFRELNSSIIRMATLAPQANITLEQVEKEILRLKQNWGKLKSDDPLIPLEIDEFDRYQLEKVIEICQKSSCLSEAGRLLFAVSRIKKQRSNDADRLKKYLAKFGLNWDMVNKP